MFSMGEFATFSRDNMVPDSPYFTPQHPISHSVGSNPPSSFSTQDEPKVPMVGNVAGANAPYAPRDMFADKPTAPNPNAPSTRRRQPQQQQTGEYQRVAHFTNKKTAADPEEPEITFIPEPKSIEPVEPFVDLIPPSKPLPSTMNGLISLLFVIFIVLCIIGAIIFSWWVPLGSPYEKRFRLFANSLIGIAILILAFVLTK